MTETINGLHSCKPGNDPQIGQIKTFVIEQRKGKSGKPYIKIRSANAENGGTPHRILGAEKTDFVDQYGNHSYNLEVESTTQQPSSFQQTKAAMETHQVVNTDTGVRIDPVHAQQGEDGVMATRKHLMQSANLLVLCIRAVENAVAPHQPVVAQTSEQFQSDVAKLFIEASSRRTSDGVNWWSFIDRMPATPLAMNGKKHVPAPVTKEEDDDEPPF